MTQPELILRLLEMLLEERDKNNSRPKVEETKKEIIEHHKAIVKKLKL